MAQTDGNPRGTGNRATDSLPSGSAGNPGTFLGVETVNGASMARFRAEPGTWVSASMKSLGYDRIYARDEAYGAYRGLAKSPSGQTLTQPDRLTPGQEYLIPVPGASSHNAPRTDSASGGGRTGRRDRPGWSGDLTSRRDLFSGRFVAPARPIVGPQPYDEPDLPEPLPSPWRGPWMGLGEFGPLGLAAVAAIVTALSLRQQRNEFEQRVRERGLTWRNPPSDTAPTGKKKQPSAPKAPDPVFAERLRQLWQNELITDDEYLLALRTGLLPGEANRTERVRDALVRKLMEQLTNDKTHQAAIDGLLKVTNGLTRIAVHIKRLGQMSGATIEIVAAHGTDGKKYLVAGLNSSARWTEEQLAELARLKIKVAPQRKGLEENELHAEENILWLIADEKGRPIKWSNAPVGKGKTHSDVCKVCRAKIRDAGGVIEPGMHNVPDTQAPPPPAPEPPDAGS